MLIIFDLDDTLIDTSGYIIPIRLKKALDEMINFGLILSDREKALERLYHLNKVSLSSKEAIKIFLNEIGASSSFQEIGIKEIYDKPLGKTPVFPLEGVSETLNDLRSGNELAIVTTGKYTYQRAKIKKAGIDSDIFSKIIVSNKSGKGRHYKSLAKKFDFSADKILVCGDRVLADLRPAKELGYKTVHMMWGRGLLDESPKDMIDYKISSFPQIKHIVQKHI